MTTAREPEVFIKETWEPEWRRAWPDKDGRLLLRPGVYSVMVVTNVPPPTETSHER